MGEVTWNTLDIWIPAGGFTAIIGTQLRGGSTKSVLVDKMALGNSPSKAHHQTHDLRRAVSGSAQEGKRIAGISSSKTAVGQLFEEFLETWIKGLPIAAPDILDHTYCV